jgi:hypothetical protein
VGILFTPQAAKLTAAKERARKRTMGLKNFVDDMD